MPNIYIALKLYTKMFTYMEQYYKDKNDTEKTKISTDLIQFINASLNFIVE